MNKKIIKYLIWIILITALLILMPMKQAVAYSTTVLYSTFATSEDLFCLNKGQHFTYDETFEVGPFSTERFREITGQNVDEDVLKFIMAESVSGKYGERTSSGNYIPQIAVWKLAGTSLSNSNADKLIANAYAYKNFPKDTIPTIEKYGYDGFAIKYFQASGTYNGVTGSYTNLLTDTISVTGASYSTTQSVGGGYYRRIYTKTSDSTEATISFNYETNRSANLEIYDSNEVAGKKVTYYKQTKLYPEHGDGTGKVVKIGDTYYHEDCNGYQGLMPWIIVDQNSDYSDTTDAFFSQFIHYYYGYFLRLPLNIDYSAVNAEGITTYYRCMEHDYVSYVIGVNDNTGDVYRIIPKDLEVKKHGGFIGIGAKDTLFAKLYPEKFDLVDEDTTYEPQNLLHGNGNIETGTITDTVKFITPVKLDFNKKDFSGNDVSGATLRLEGVENVASLTRSYISIGSGSVTVQPAEGNSGTFKIKLTETAPTNYIAIPETTITVSYNDGTITGITSSNDTYVPGGGNTVTVKNRPAVKLTFKKQDFLGNALANAIIRITAEENVSKFSKTTLTSNANGDFGTITVYPTNPTGEFKIQVEETKAPAQYRRMQGKVTITVTYNIDTGAVTGISSTNTTYVPVSGSTVTVKNRPAVKLTFEKEDFWNTPIEGARISVTGYQNVLEVENGNLTSDSNGDFGIPVIYPEDDSGIFKVKITETYAPTGYEKVPGSVILTFKYNIDTGEIEEITSSNTKYVPIVGKTVLVKNQSKIHNFKIIKKDTLTGALVSGMTFDIEFTGVESITGYSGKPSTIRVTTNSRGEISLNNLLLETDEKEIKIKITEVAVKDYRPQGYYYILDSTPIEMTLTYNNGAWTLDGSSVNGVTISSEEPTLSDGVNVSVEIYNKPFVNYKGVVWHDGQSGQKNVQAPNGMKDSREQRLKGVIVKLYDVKAGKYVREEIITPEDGSYSYMDLPRTFEGYIVEFRYDGINWQETKGIRNKTGGDSDASEDSTARTSFNNKYKTISLGKSNDGTALNYTYSDNKSTLKVDMQGNETGTTNYKFQMIAKTKADTFLNDNADCGLVNKKIDLAIGTDVKSAQLKINGKTTQYNYAQIVNGEFEDALLDNRVQNNSSTKEDVTYNLYLYSSDYHYRIEDYKTDIIGSVAPDSDGNNIADYEELKNLEAFVTYSVILKNQTTNNATVNEFVYYYDAAYTPYNIVSTDKYNVSIDETNRKITFTTKGDGLKITSPNYRIEIDLTFKVNKNADGYLVTKTSTNVAEIIKYSTDMGGLIDIDSEPGNATVTVTNGTPKITAKYEDDIDEARGLNIAVKEERIRTITGTVFDDTYTNGVDGEYDKDGILNNSKTAVNDVIVQLIEIKKIGGQYYEYIWQETRSGSNQVKVTARNGYPGTAYTNSVQEGSGKFEFKEFIAGNYIIRYIYGDGRTYEITDNVKQYNGQDYKSTIDPNYKKAWYNTSNYSEGASVARDNEARRLEVMAYSTTIDETIGKALEEKTALNETWMSAETSKINIPVDDVEDAKTKTAQNNTISTSTSYEYTANGELVLFGDMNFGLALRPQANIVLEKHITSLKITPTGTGVQSILDAKAESIESIVNGTEVNVNGITDGLATIKSTPDNRGFWQVATDVEELMQGAELEVEYTYVLRNDSEKDYLTTFLIDAYKNGIDDGTYPELLRTKAAEVKNNTKGQTEKYGTFLGEFYYTGTKGANDSVVPTRIEKFEEALNNDLIFDENEATSFEIAEQGVNRHIYGVDKVEGKKETNIDVVIKNTKVSKFLLPNPNSEESYTTETAEWDRTLRLTSTLATVAGGELGANLPSYIAEVLQYSNPAGRKDMKATPANLDYVHSDDSTMTMVSDNEQDEFWGEAIIITKPTGADKLTPIKIVLITISAVAVLGVGIVLIKRYVLKK